MHVVHMTSGRVIDRKFMQEKPKDSEHQNNDCNRDKPVHDEFPPSVVDSF
jgi:hypothetical protein